MLSMLRQILVFEMTIAEWIGTAVMLAVPYLAIGVLWSRIHSGSALASIVWWPVQLVTTVCLA